MKNLLPLEVFTYDDGRRLLVVLDDEHVAVGRCSPFGITSPDGDAVDAVDKAPLRISIMKADVGIASCAVSVKQMPVIIQNVFRIIQNAFPKSSAIRLFSQ